MGECPAVCEVVFGALGLQVVERVEAAETAGELVPGMVGRGTAQHGGVVTVHAWHVALAAVAVTFEHGPTQAAPRTG